MAALLLLLLPLLALPASACGFTIHMSVTHRALNSFFGGPPAAFETLLAENRGAVEGGSPYCIPRAARNEKQLDGRIVWPTAFSLAAPSDTHFHPLPPL